MPTTTGSVPAAATTPATGTAPPAAGAFRVGPTARRAWLVLHILGAGAWVGIDVVLGVLVFTAVLTSSPSTEALGYRALELFAVWPLLTAGLVTLVTGVVLGLGTRYGLVRYWWVAVKLALNVVLVGLVAVLLRPGVGDAAAYGEALAAGGAVGGRVGDLVFPPLVSGTALVVATVLGVVKPWGRIRRRR